MNMMSRYGAPIAIILIFLENMFMTTWFICVLTPKFGKKWTWIYYYLISCSLHFVSAFIPAQFSMAIWYTVNFTLLCAMFADKIATKLIKWGLALLGMMVSQCILAVVVWSMGISMEYIVARPVLQLTVLFLSYVIYIPYLIIVERILKRRGTGLPNKDFLSFAMVPACEVGVLALLMGCVVIVEVPLMYLFVLVATILVICSILLMFRGLRRLEETTRAETRYEYLKVQQQQQLEHYAALQAQIQETRRLRHDFLNYAQTMEILASRGHYDEVEACAAQLRSDLSGGTEVYYCENPIANALLYHKLEYARTLGIQAEVHITLPQSCRIENGDLISLLGNLLDNAIEGSSASPEPRTIALSDRLQAGFYTLTVQNSKTPSAVPFSEGRPVTAKKDKENHGIGTEIIAEITRRYDGTLRFHDEGERFFTIVMLRAADKF